MKTQKSIKHVVGFSGALAALLMVVALIATTPAIGGNNGAIINKYSGSATLTAVGDELDASGAAKLGATVTTYFYSQVSGNLSVTCQGLTPDASYVVAIMGWIQNPGGIASTKGYLKISSSFTVGSKANSGYLPGNISVYRVEPATNILVLSGAITWR
jgi:hypothetical protein